MPSHVEGLVLGRSSGRPQRPAARPNGGRRGGGRRRTARSRAVPEFAAFAEVRAARARRAVSGTGGGEGCRPARRSSITRRHVRHSPLMRERVFGPSGWPQHSQVLASREGHSLRWQPSHGGRSGSRRRRHGQQVQPGPPWRAMRRRSASRYASADSRRAGGAGAAGEGVAEIRSARHPPQLSFGWPGCRAHHAVRPVAGSPSGPGVIRSPVGVGGSAPSPRLPDCRSRRWPRSSWPARRASRGG